MVLIVTLYMTAYELRVVVFFSSSTFLKSANKRSYRKHLLTPTENDIILAVSQTWLRYVWLMAWQIHLSVVCLSSVTCMHPTQGV